MPPRPLDQEIPVDLTKRNYAQENGWGLYATKDISRRERIISILRPLVISLDKPRLKDTCYACLGYRLDIDPISPLLSWSNDSKLQICTGCHVVRYCTKECQAQSWKTVHRHECALFARLYPNILPNNVRAVVQLLLLRKASKLPSGEWQDFIRLESHLDKWEARGGQDWENICLMARGTKEYSGTDISEQTLREIFCKLIVNCFTMVSSCYDPLGLVLHPLPALINHDCKYNAFVRFDYTGNGHRLSVCALRPIACGEQIVVSYIDATNPCHVRQQELEERYFFTCRCSRCSNALAEQASTPHAPYPSDRLLLEQRAFELLASARKDTSITGPILKLQYGIHILRKTGNWRLHHQPLASLRQQLVVSLITAGQFHLAFVHAWIQYSYTDHKLMPESHHPIRLVHQWLIVALIRHIPIAEHNGKDYPVQKYNILNRSLNLSIILNYILHHLYQKTKADCSDCGTFAQMVEQAFDRVYFETGRLTNDESTKAQYQVEAAKLKACTTEILEQELLWGEADAEP